MTIAIVPQAQSIPRAETQPF